MLAMFKLNDEDSTGVEQAMLIHGGAEAVEQAESVLGTNAVDV
jgi:hypothetical protein